MKAHIDFQTPKQYKDEVCKQCGTCLASCPVMRLSPEEARREIRNLREGAESRALRNQGPALLSRKRFKAPDVDTGIEQ